MMDKLVLNLIPCNVFPDINSLINCRKDDIFSPLHKIYRHIISEKNKKQEQGYLMLTSSYMFFIYFWAV